MRKIVFSLIAVVAAGLIVWTFLAFRRAADRRTMTPPNAGVTRNGGTKAGREKVVQQSRALLLKDGIEASVEGADGDTLVLRSARLSNFQMLGQIKNDLEDFRAAGFSEIRLTDPTGAAQTVDLRVLSPE